MTDFLTKTERSVLMAKVRSTDTEPERVLLAALRKAGVRPTTQANDLPGKPDIVFRKDKLVCFVDGELWHGVQWRRRGLDFLDQQFANAENRERWVKKVQGNVRRDLRVTGELIAMGWRVVRFWANDILANPEAPAKHAAWILAIKKNAPEKNTSEKNTPEKNAPKNDALAMVGRATSADFFAGIGLMSLGLNGAGWQTVWANDYDASKNKLFTHNHPPENNRPPEKDNHVTLDPRSILDLTAKDFPKVGLVTACFPCTDLSLAGGRKGIEAGPQSSTFLSFAQLLDAQKKKRPPFVVLENVLALVNSRGGKDFRIVLERLGGAGYRVDVVKIDARHFVPQSRQRVFIVGVRDDVQVGPTYGVEDLNEPTELRPAKLVEFMKANTDLAWGLRRLPALPTCDRTLKDVLEDLPFDDQAWWNAARMKKLRGQVSERHLKMVKAGIANDGVVWATGFRRMRHGRSMVELRFDGVAGCLRTPKGGSAKQILLRADKKGWRARLLTPRECARLMGADDFRLDLPGLKDHDAYFGFGDAVCVPAVTWLIENYVNPIAAELIRGRVMGRM